MKTILATVLLTLSPLWVLAEDSYGTLNPEEMSMNKNIERALRGETSMTICASGYLMTKSGRHEEARRVFEACAEDGYTGTMTWMSYMENNGFGGDYDPDRAAKWNKRAAELGDPVGMFNYGLDLLRGHGVRQDQALGRQWVDAAAQKGLHIAQRLQNAGYNPDEVTPDADNWKYAPMF